MLMIFLFVTLSNFWLNDLWKKKDELVPIEYINELNKRLSSQKGIKVEFQAVQDANHFFSKNENNLVKELDKYIKKEIALY